MAAPYARTPDAIAAALVAVLTPGGTWTDSTYSGGTPIGTLGTVSRRSVDTPFQAATPLVLVRPVQNVHMWVAGRAKEDRGHLELRYRDVPLAQQQALNSAITQSQIEDALWGNFNAITAQLDAYQFLDGAVAALGPYESRYNPDGYTVDWDSSMWLGWDLIVEYRSVKIII